MFFSPLRYKKEARNTAHVGYFLSPRRELRSSRGRVNTRNVIHVVALHVHTGVGGSAVELVGQLTASRGRVNTRNVIHVVTLHTGVGGSAVDLVGQLTASRGRVKTRNVIHVVTLHT